MTTGTACRAVVAGPGVRVRRTFAKLGGIVPRRRGLDRSGPRARAGADHDGGPRRTTPAGGVAVHRNAVAVARALREAGAEGEVVELAASTRTAGRTAQALGCPAGAVASGQVFLADGEPVLVLASGDHRVDVEATAAALGATELTRPKAPQVRAATGQPVAGVSPLGHPRRLRTVIDVDLLRYDVVWAAAGTPQAVFPTSFAELVRLCDAEPVRLT
ncbi:YbaK/EbsC family protein [Kineococcus sp. LSe6-4]|uniref:YbaK/EbsC family protein n=1 Tax=Kineococcus halophytocola TaxID=3234027 RepID=A0ABV4GYT6_9ACTN